MACDLDGAIIEIIKTPRPVIFDYRIIRLANGFLIIPSGKAYNEMLIGEDEADQEVVSAIDAKGKMQIWP